MPQNYSDPAQEETQSPGESGGLAPDEIANIIEEIETKLAALKAALAQTPAGAQDQEQGGETNEGTSDIGSRTDEEVIAGIPPSPRTNVGMFSGLRKR